ncbi:hypothetical protein [Bartonella koehlerae]|uniref:Uncharacterized protein n=1 Tax=Bartonella koehlerae C-29 TaxID=1134510 RepID=A0A067WGD8_9HYPH|nr:hypothetical protein [Bartonella koehlerae]KEC55883.1 hypothetical protein O9A_00438 [Bartonella koehlerae C-29]
MIFVTPLLKHSLGEENDTDNTENITGYWEEELKTTLLHLALFYKICTAMKTIMMEI